MQMRFLLWKKRRYFKILIAWTELKLIKTPGHSELPKANDPVIFHNINWYTSARGVGIVDFVVYLREKPTGICALTYVRFLRRSTPCIKYTSRSCKLTLIHSCLFPVCVCTQPWVRTFVCAHICYIYIEIEKVHCEYYRYRKRSLAFQA